MISQIFEKTNKHIVRGWVKIKNIWEKFPIRPDPPQPELLLFQNYLKNADPLPPLGSKNGYLDLYTLFIIFEEFSPHP